MKQLAFIFIQLFSFNIALLSQALVDPYKLYSNQGNVTTPMPSPSYGVIRNNDFIPDFKIQRN